MATSPTSASEPSDHGRSNEGIGIAATVGAVGTAATTVGTLPQAFEQYPKGGAMVAFLVIAVLLCWVIVTWLKNRRS